MSPMSRRGDGGAQLPRLDAVDPVEEAHQGQATTSSRPRTVLDADHYGLEKVKERILEYLAVQQRSDKVQGPDPVPGRPARRRQDLARQVDRQGDRPQLRAHVAGRRARRGRDPRPPAHLYRLDARQGHPGHEEGEDRPTRCSCSTRSTSWAPTGAATRPRRCWRCWTPSRTATFNDHYLEVDYDLSDVMFVTTANSAAHAAAADGPHGDHPHPRLHRG